MPIKYVVSAVSALGLFGVSSLAQAGSCGGQNCQIPMSHLGGPAPVFDAMTVATVNPMGHLRSVNFQRAPHISIMRVHGMPATVNLSDAPIGFTGGCHAQSTQYCRQSETLPLAAAPLPLAPTPSSPVAIAQPLPAPLSIITPPPTYSAPAPIMPTIRPPLFGQGYDPSKFAPRQYGDPSFVPGIAHVPTSFVDRDPFRADQALNSGRAIPQPLANGGVAPRPAMVATYGGALSNFGSGRVMNNSGFISAPLLSQPVRPAPVFPAPVMQVPRTGGPNFVRLNPQHSGLSGGAPVLQHDGTYASSIGADGTYWEKASGPTMFGNTMATQVICKRQAPSGCASQSNLPHAVPPHVMNGWTY